MSAVALDLPGEPSVKGMPGGTHEPVPSRFEDVGGEPTLDELLSGAWEGLAAHQHVVCPVCRGDMTPVYGAQARPIGGRCQSCDAKLS